MRVTVYAGSAAGNRPVFTRSAAEFACRIVESGAEIVYGGGAVGLMGAVADAGLAAGGRVIGVMPKSLAAAEVAHPNLSELHVVESMHERKQLMADLGDCFVALPGGVGTLEEILEVWAWLVLGHHAKPVTLLNVDGYWDRMLRMVQRMAASGFLKAAECGSLIPIADADDLHAVLADWRPPPPRWG